jgi:hypothetical protein
MRSTQHVRAALIAAFVAALAGLVACSYQQTNVHAVDVSALEAARPQRTALLGLIVRSNYTFEAPNAGTQETRRSFAFMLDRDLTRNPHADAPRLADERAIYEEWATEFAEERSRRTARTLLEAYCAAIDDLEPIRYFEQRPTGFGRARFIAERNAIVDTLAMVAHAYVDRSLMRHLTGAESPVGELVGHTRCLDALLAGDDPGLYGRILASVQESGEIAAADRRAACRMLGVDAIMFVAVAYDYVSVLESSQYGSRIFSAIRAETDVAVFGAEHDQPLASVGFNREHEKHLEGLDDVGKLIRKGLRGDLEETSAANERAL